MVNNLVNGVNYTRDDFNMWLTPFTKGEDHTVDINLNDRVHSLSMIRIWNYNKSRIHSQRGVKLITIHLDGQLIFRGEI